MAAGTHRRRERLWLYVAVIAACVVGFGLHATTLEQAAEQIVRHEDAARAHVLRVLAAQERHRERSGRYGTLEELLAAGDLEGYRARPGADGVPCLQEDGYRLDVLLPHRRAGEGRVFLTVASVDEVSADLRKKHHAVVARPLVPATSGFRTLYADEAGDVYVSEGASDEPSRATNPLPQVHLSSGTPRSPLGLVWMRWEDIEAHWRGK
ncbi:MAG: hypothetical protein QNJ98_11615 [Planctomycetota bacterium]|nr:hypothetical protein [Planctomycetota bacterium]